MKNVKELRVELVEIFNNLKADKLEVNKAKELVNCAGKILNTAKIQMAYNDFVGKKEPIEFLE